MTECEKLENAIATLETMKKQFLGETRNVIDVAINALEKQIPKKPENKKYSFYPHSNLLKSKYGECPVCKTIQADDEYCANCGQKLDWSEEE